MLVQDFSQSTTFHGVKYIFQTDSTAKRRLLWLFAWLTSIVLFLCLIKQKLDLYFLFPSAIEINEEHVKSLKFPAVTVCYKSQFGISQLYKTGLYDVLSMSSAAIKSGYYGYFYNESVCTVPIHSRFNKTIASTSIAVCQQLCQDEDIYEMNCLGLFWFQTNQTCLMTSYSGNGELRNNCSEINRGNKIMYFRKIREIHRRPIYCTFDDVEDTGSCPLHADHRLSLSWKITTYKMPKQFYNTIYPLGDDVLGKVFKLHSLRPSVYVTEPIARFWTPLINTTNKCLLFKHLSEFVKLQLSLTSEHSTVTIDKSDTYRAFHFDLTIRWSVQFIHLPAGLHKISLTALGQGEQRVISTIDDFSIRPCEDFKRECLLSSNTMLYMGRASTTVNNVTCEPWRFYDDVKSFTNELNMTNSLYNISQVDMNYCRYVYVFEKDIMDIFCVLNGRLERCPSIPYCDCATGWSKCMSGQCIPTSYFCDGKNDCLDFSDEASEHCQYILQNFPVKYGISRPDEDLNLYDKEEPLLRTNYNQIIDQLLSSVDDKPMSHFMNEVSHGIGQFKILKCLWEGRERCGRIEERFTDMGFCYTFNANSTGATITNKVGEKESGLYLLFNAASYETIDNTDTSNGLKLLLFDPTTDIEIMQDYGIHLMPGHQTSIEITTEIGNYLKEPYGRCGSIPLSHTNDTYSLTKCIRDKQTSQFIRQLGCKNYYMTGLERECNASEYFLKFQNITSLHTTYCPSDCVHTSYRRSLSMSVLSREQFMSIITMKQLKGIQEQLINANEIRTRADISMLIPFLRTLDNLSVLSSIISAFIEDEVLKNSTLNVKFYIPVFFDRYTFVMEAYNAEIVEYRQNYQTASKNIHHFGLKLLFKIVNFSYFITEITANTTVDNMNITRKDNVETISEVYVRSFIQNITDLILQLRNDSSVLTEKAQFEILCYPTRYPHSKCYNAQVHLNRLAKKWENELREFINVFDATLEYDKLVNETQSYVPIADVIFNHFSLSNLSKEAAEFSLYYNISSECLSEFDGLLEQLYNLTGMDPLTHSAQSYNRFTANVIKQNVESLKGIQRKINGVLNKYYANNITRLLAGDVELLPIIKEMTATVEHIKNLIYAQLHVVWPENVQRDCEHIAGHLYKVLYLTRTANRLCEKNDSFDSYVVGSFLYLIINPQALGLHSTNLQEFYDVFMASANETFTINENFSVHLMQIRENLPIYDQAEYATKEISSVLNKGLLQLDHLKELLGQISYEIMAYNKSLQIDENFVKENIVAVKIYFSEMKIKYVKQNVAYSLFSLFSDAGGSIGLLLGASVLSLLEIIDYLILYFYSKICVTYKQRQHQDKPRNQSAFEKPINMILADRLSNLREIDVDILISLLETLKKT